MKQKTLFLTLLIMGVFVITSNAQLKIPSSKDIKKVEEAASNKDFAKDILKALDPGSSLDISPDKLLQLQKGNKSFVGDVMGILNGSGSEDEKMSLIGKKHDERKDFIENLLGEGKAAKYYSLVKKQVEPLLGKYKLAKLFI